MRKKHKTRKNTEPHLWRSLLYGCLVNTAFTCLILLLFTKIAYESQDPRKMLLPFALVALLLCGFGAGFFSAKFYRRQGASIGVIAGFFFCVLLLSLSFGIQAPAEAQSWLRWLSYPMVLLLATAGGMAGKEKQRKRKRHGY